ncbi:sulfurtransferase TusA family protein [Anoxynatronum buryatiense]|uniref:TusA-related sulfurtransferase n=1 Tax=Anoxynatronum buryatiense TaxID=489973 RepID=A0AA46AHN1_9CLOT|nr:sulfurtransferase TusA family protein [Anoxynatronum buryatiense]SMP40394.1 TusA-related sulfurtransferase [Anoxynatronum buryatiense]
MLNSIDARGLSCPQPVLLTKKAIDQQLTDLTILVDNETAKGNVLRFLQNAGYTVDIDMSEDTYQLQAKKS